MTATAAPQQGLATTTEVAAPRGPSGRAGLALGLGRAAEQGSYGLTMLVLAARMEVAAFGPIAALLVVNSVALTLADLGLAHDLLRATAGRAYSRQAVTRQRLLNMAAAAVCVAIGLRLGGSTGLLVALSGGIWASGGEAYLRQAAALRAARVRAHVVVDVVTAVMLVGVVALLAAPGDELLVCGLALIAHHLLVALLLPVGEGLLGDVEDGAVAARPAGFLATHVLGYGTRNMDYLLAGPLLGATSFSTYVLGYRLANAPSAPLGAVVLRWGLARLGPEDRRTREETHRNTVRALFLLGIAAMCCTVIAAQVLPVLIGERWRGAAGLAAVIAIALPWRLLDGLIGAVGFSAGAGRLLVVFESARLVATTVAIAVGAIAGLEWFVVASAIVAIVSITAGHVLSARAARIAPCRWLVAVTPLAVAATLAWGVFSTPV